VFFGQAAVSEVVVTNFWRRRRRSEAGGGLKVKHPDADYQAFWMFVQLDLWISFVDPSPGGGSAVLF
jgi:hypothetical protein